MLGFDALGRLALGQIRQDGAVAVVITASAGAYTLTGNAITLNTTLAASAGAYVFTGNAALFNTSMAVSAGSFSLTGNAVSFNAGLVAGAGAYALSGVDTAFAVNFVASGGTITITSGDHTLTRTGDETEQVYGGVGHYLEELAKKRKLEKITRRNPPPIVQRPPELRPFAVSQPEQQPDFGVLTNPDALAGQYEAQAMQAQQMAAAEQQRQRNRRALAVLLLAA